MATTSNQTHYTYTPIAFEHLREFYQDPPFNDLWPPTYFPRVRGLQHNEFARHVWYDWLLQGWLHDRPYRDLQILDYHPLVFEQRQAERLAERRNRTQRL
jgi:hypothetical protein